MKFAPRCECEKPLTITEEDFCSYCSRSTAPVGELPPNIEEGSLDTRLDAAESMYRENGGQVQPIMAALNLTERQVLKRCDFDRYEELRKNKLAAERLRRGHSEFGIQAIADLLEEHAGVRERAKDHKGLTDEQMKLARAFGKAGNLTNSAMARVLGANPLTLRNFFKREELADVPA